MTYSHKRIASQIARVGREAQILVKTTNGKNEFGNTDHTYSPDRKVLAAKTYPNRNTEINSGIGDREQDNPVFIVPIGGDQPEAPSTEDRIVFDGTKYEIQALTPYQTHIEFFGEPVIH